MFRIKFKQTFLPTECGRSYLFTPAGFIHHIQFALVTGTVACFPITRLALVAYLWIPPLPSLECHEYPSIEKPHSIMVPIHYGFFKNKVCETRFLKLYFSNL